MFFWLIIVLGWGTIRIKTMGCHIHSNSVHSLKSCWPIFQLYWTNLAWQNIMGEGLEAILASISFLTTSTCNLGQQLKGNHDRLSILTPTKYNGNPYSKPCAYLQQAIILNYPICFEKRYKIHTNLVIYWTFTYSSWCNLSFH